MNYTNWFPGEPSCFGDVEKRKVVCIIGVIRITSGIRVHLLVVRFVSYQLNELVLQLIACN